jgi:peptide/nickel transport system substrate-binding protein
MKNTSSLLTRRTLGAVAAASALVLGMGHLPALAATPADTLVLAWAFDDMITLDPGEGV